jgi:AraC-like DNA-binding protein
MSQIIQVLFYLGAIQGMLLAIFLFSIKSNKISNKLLGLLTLFWAIVLFQFPLQEEGLYINYPHLLKTISNLLFAFFPLLFLHVKYLLSDFKKFSKMDLWHFVPLLMNIILHLPFYIMDGQEKIDVIRNNDYYYRVIGIIGDEIIAIQGIVYSILVLRRLNFYSKEIENFQSSVNKTTIHVLVVGTSLTLFAWLVGTVGVHLDFFEVKIKIDLFMYVYLVLVLVIYFMSYMSLKTPEMFKLQEASFAKNAELDFEEKPPMLTPETYEEINKETKQQLQKTERFMEEEKPYLNPDLNLQSLSDSLDISRHKLSAIFNQQFHMNFYEFVNLYRVNEVKALMQKAENKNLKLMSLAYDAGFNSKSSFNRAFKLHVGVTPSEYWKTVWK